MEVTDLQNFLVIEFLEQDESKWKDVLNYILPLATSIEFNILYSDHEFKEFLTTFSKSIIEIKKERKNKVYPSGKILRMNLTDEVINFVRAKGFYGFKNWFLEDPSFYLGDNEVIATITHEDQIYFDPNYVDLSHFPTFKLEHKLLNTPKKGFWEKLLEVFSWR